MPCPNSCLSSIQPSHNIGMSTCSATTSSHSSCINLLSVVSEVLVKQKLAAHAGWGEKNNNTFTPSCSSDRIVARQPALRWHELFTCVKTDPQELFTYCTRTMRFSHQLLRETAVHFQHVIMMTTIIWHYRTTFCLQEVLG